MYGTEERSIGILHSGNPSCVEGGDVEQGARTSKQTFGVCVCLIYPSLSLCLFLYLAFNYCLDHLHARYTLVHNCYILAWDYC